MSCDHSTVRDNSNNFIESLYCTSNHYPLTRNIVSYDLVLDDMKLKCLQWM